MLSRDDFNLIISDSIDQIWKCMSLNNYKETRFWQLRDIEVVTCTDLLGLLSSSNKQSLLRLHVRRQVSNEQWESICEDIGVIQDDNLCCQLELMERDDDIAMDEQSISSIMLLGYIDIALHPVYQLPNAYLQIQTSNGSIVSCESLQKLIDQFNHRNHNLTNEQRESVIDHRYYEFGRLLSEEHPFIGNVCCSLHICELGQRLETASQLNHSSLRSNYILIWLSIVGRHIGLDISHLEFISMEHKLL